jgi:hypothetical protein
LFFELEYLLFLPFKLKGIPLIICGTKVMKLVNEVPLNLTGTVFEITRNLLNFTRNEKLLNLTEIMFEITINHFNIIRNGETFDLIRIAVESTGNNVIITLSTAINLIEVQEVSKRTGFSLHISKLKHFYQQTYICIIHYTKLFGLCLISH